jgi:hypothetical protein
MVDRPRVEGEIIERRVRKVYLEMRDDLREGPVDYSVIGALQDLLRPFVRTNGLVDLADRHLIDAANEELPEDVRAEHFDIAGSLVWQFMTETGHQFPEGAAFIHTWKGANGV